MNESTFPALKVPELRHLPQSVTRFLCIYPKSWPSGDRDGGAGASVPRNSSWLSSQLPALPSQVTPPGPRRLLF